MMTVEKLIKALENFPKDMEVVVSIPYGREGEFAPISPPQIKTMDEQNDDGDPMYNSDDREVVVI